MTDLAPHMSAFMLKRLPVERAASLHTCDAYAYAFRLLLQFVSDKLKVRPSALKLKDLDAPIILEFLEHLGSVRGNTPRTRNARLTAIKSFMRFVEYREPSALGQVKRVLSIPVQKTDTRLVETLSAEECQAILDSPAAETRLGIRDRTMLFLAIAGGFRVSELVELRLDMISFPPRYVDVRVQGKGRKERIIRLWAAVSKSLRAWLAVRGLTDVPELFLNARGQQLTRAGFEYILRKHVASAANRCSSLNSKRISPHTLRHTCALNILQATNDVRKVALWLGHESIQTTEEYLRVDVTKRIGVLEVVTPPQLRPGRFSPPDALLHSLKS